MSYNAVVKPRFLVPAILALAVIVVFSTVPFFRDMLPSLWGAPGEPQVPSKLPRNDDGPAEIVSDKNGNPVGLKLSDEAMKGLRPDPVAAKDTWGVDNGIWKPKIMRALPPQFGTVNYDLERLQIVNALFPGQIAEFEQVDDFDGPAGAPTKKRALRVGDTVKQGQRLAVVYSATLGQAKSALVDAISALKLSKTNLARQQDAYYDAALSLATLLGTERQVRGDANAFLAAERALYTYKLNNADIKELQKEADNILENAKKNIPRDAEAEAKKWATVTVTVPKIPGIDPEAPFTIVEKNVNINQNVDPINSLPMFKLADMKRLEVWVNAHEEYFSVLHDKMTQGGLNWKIMFKAYPDDDPMDLRITKVNPAIDPNLRTCLVTGYLPNPDGKYLVGQFVTANIDVDPERYTVEIPTYALNDADGESLVFVQDQKTKDGKSKYEGSLTFDPQRFFIKRVAVTQRFKEFTNVRSRLTVKDKQISDGEVKKGKRRIEELQPGDLVITRGVVEMKAAFDQLSAKYHNERQQLRGN